MAIEHKNSSDGTTDSPYDGGRHEPRGVSRAGVGDVYVADGAGSGVWKAAVDHYGQMSIVANTTAQTVAAATPEQLIGDDATGQWVTGLVNGVTFDSSNQSLSVLDNGIYILDFWVSFKAPNSSNTTFYFSIDGGSTLSTQTMTRTSTSATDLGVVSARSLVSLTTSAVIEIHVENDVGGLLYFQDGGMTLVQVEDI